MRHTFLMHASRQQNRSAVKSIYGERATVADEGRTTAVQALQATFECRKLLHDEVMDKLDQPNLTDRIGLGPFFAKMHLETCDQSLRLACSVRQRDAPADFVESLDRLIHVEASWSFPRLDRRVRSTMEDEIRFRKDLEPLSGFSF